MSNTTENFKEKIRKEIEHFTPKQAVLFAWLCAIRALPFIGSSGKLNFKHEPKQSKHLYNILYALDITATCVVTTALNTTTAAVTAHDAVFSNAYIAANAATSFAANAIFATYTAIRTADAVSDTAYTPDVIANTTASTASNANKAFQSSNNDTLNMIIFDDIAKIIAGASDFNNDVSIYGDVWDNFQNALRDIGCEYWGQLYTRIFENHFKLDEAELLRRVNVPAEIREKGAADVANYLSQLESQGSKRLNEARIIILGEKGAGKTCLARRLLDLDAPMTVDDESTEGVDTTVWKIADNTGDSSINVHIWDFAGHVVTHAAHRCFLSERCLYIIVYDGRTENRNDLNYWLDHVKNYGNDAPVKILVNTRDGNKPDIPVNTLRQKYPFIVDFTYLSIADNQTLEMFRKETAEYIQNNPSWNNLLIPTGYFAVKEDIEKYFQQNKEKDSIEFFAKEFFDSIAENNKISDDDFDSLLTALHELGICLWYSDLAEFNTMVLNPSWITHGIYRLINWASNNDKHTISISDSKTIFEDEQQRYPDDKLHFIFSLMRKYELAYSSESENSITIPFLLKEDRPATLPEFPVDNSLMIRYEAEQKLPPNTVARFIVRHYRNCVEVWRYGAVLTCGKDTVALVVEDERKVTVSVKGSDKSKFIIELRETLSNIFADYKSNKPELLYKLITDKPIILPHFDSSIKNDGTIMLPCTDIIRYIVNRRDYYSPAIDMDISLELTEKEYNITNNYNFYNVYMADGKMTLGHNSPITDNITTFNFNNCNVALQGELNHLLGSLKKAGYDDEDTQELEEAISDLSDVEKIEDKEKLIKSGRLIKLKNFIEELSDENSSKRKTIEKVKNGVKTLQSIASKYNDIAQWVGWPQVPRPFLGKS